MKLKNHPGYEHQSKLWKQIPQQVAGHYTLLMQDNSTNKLLFAALLKFESHYPPPCGIVQLTNSAALRFRNWSFTNKNRIYNSRLPGSQLLYSNFFKVTDCTSIV